MELPRFAFVLGPMAVESVPVACALSPHAVLPARPLSMAVFPPVPTLSHSTAEAGCGAPLSARARIAALAESRIRAGWGMKIDTRDFDISVLQ